MNRRKILKPAGLFILFYFTVVNLSAQIYFDEFGFPVEDATLWEQFRDTVYIHDTLIVADIDALVRIAKEDLRPFAKRYEELTEMIDSLNKVTSDRVYYNFYLPRDSAHQLSNRFIIKEYNITTDHFIQASDRTKDWDMIRDTSLIRKELLFNFDANNALTGAFLKNKLLIRKTLSRMFTTLSETPGIVGINLYFPHYNFKEKRDMVQFVKSVRILMDASEKFKPHKVRLNVTFPDRGRIDENFSYCLLQEAGEVLYINSSDLLDRHYAEGKRVTFDNIQNIKFIPQLKNHFYIARVYTGKIDIRQQNLTDFSESVIEPIINADYPENNWEIYLFIFIVLMVIILFFILLYYTYVPFSTLVNDNLENLLLIFILLLLEIMAIIVTMFRNMCYTDTFAFMHQNPAVLFILPLAIILIAPLLTGIAKKRRVP
ncbi:MAG: hypothetical protein LUG98_10975 [Tannerellaceae bacterium]|nr:hypothetical protein [Tannerellaceae bacterium]